ncbi:MAG: serine/threonine protein kinase [Alphaproteobacteria bacterium]
MNGEAYHGALPIGFELMEYGIDRVLGQGGFGITYLAHDKNLKKKFAIKEYLPENFAYRDGDAIKAKPASKADFEWGLERFLQEARTLAQFEHPNIVPVARFFRENGTAYMVMAYQDGQDLGRILDTYGKLEETELEEVLYPLMDGLERVHNAGILHRDIKPENIFIRTDGQPVLLDFGAARQAIGERGRNVTRIVTPNYAPHEQYYSDSNMGPWTDIYALAAVIYEGIGGEPPPEAPARIAGDKMVPAVEVGRGRYRPEFLAAIDWALAVHVEDRPKSIAEWRTRMPQPVDIAVAKATTRRGLRITRIPEPRQAPPMVAPAERATHVDGPIGRGGTDAQPHAAGLPGSDAAERATLAHGGEDRHGASRAAAATDRATAAPAITQLRRPNAANDSAPASAQSRARTGGIGGRLTALIVAFMLVSLGALAWLARPGKTPDTTTVSLAPKDARPDVAKTDPVVEPDIGKDIAEDPRIDSEAAKDLRKALRPPPKKPNDSAELQRTFNGTKVWGAMSDRPGTMALTFSPGGTLAGTVTESGLREANNESDHGKWWIQGNNLCMQWSRWQSSKPNCYAIKIKGQNVEGVQDKGLNFRGTLVR